MSRGRSLAGMILALCAWWNTWEGRHSMPTARAQTSVKQTPIVIPDCRLAVIHKEDVPCQRDGIIRLIGTEVRPGEMIPPDRLVTLRAGNEEKKYRRLKEGDAILAGQLLALLDDRLAHDEWEIKTRRLIQSQADLAAAEKTRDEALERYRTQLKLRPDHATSEEEVASAQLSWYRYYYDAISKQEAVALAQLELDQAQTVLSMHEIRSSISGVIKIIYKKPGEAVKTYEPVFQVWDPTTLRIEGLMDVQHLSRLRVGMPVTVEVSEAEGPQQVLVGHLHEITGVAVSLGPRDVYVVSASEDETVRVWDRATGHELRILRHAAAVRAVACSPPATGNRLCLSGTADGSAWLWDLDNRADLPRRKLTDHHRGAVNCVTFSSDGKTCVTGGEDHELNLWDAATGEWLFSFPPGHRGPITSVQSLPNGQVFSAGRDNTLRLWSVDKRGARLEATLGSRSGEVAHPGASPDGKLLLFDQGRELRLLSLPAGLTEGVLQSSNRSADFASFALFSPDGRLIVTAANSTADVRLWKTPTQQSRGYEVRKLVTAENASPTCAAFSPDGTFLVTGTKGRNISVWPVPDPEELDHPISAELTLVEKSVESSASQVRIWADLPNPGGRLVPGTAVTVVAFP